jgi:hypothetical protein
MDLITSIHLRTFVILSAALKVDEQRPSCDLCGKIIGPDTSSFGTPEEKAADSEARLAGTTDKAGSTP